MAVLRAKPPACTFGWSRSARRRAWALLVVLAVAFAALGHVAHGHDGDSSPTTYKACTYCKTHDRTGAPPPSLALLVAAIALVVVRLLPGRHAPVTGRRSARSPCCPRAPPALRP